MLTIDRSCSYRIITRAVNDAEPLVALLKPGARDCTPFNDTGQLQTALAETPESIIVYNQHADALRTVASLSTAAQQIFIEIRQDTKGVLGLHAFRRNPAGDDTLELVYQEN